MMPETPEPVLVTGRNRLWSIAGVTAVLLSCLLATDLPAQGLLIPGAGVKNRSMGGVAIANPIDLLGALRFNPATLSAFADGIFEVSFDSGFIDAQLDTSVLLGSLEETSGSDTFSANPGLGYVFRPAENSPWTIGIGLYGVAGGSFDFDFDGVILGERDLKSSVLFATLAPTVAYEVTDNFSLGLQLGIQVVSAKIVPGILGDRNDANGDGFPSFPKGRRSDPAFGIALRFGAYWEPHADWALGFEIGSPGWFEDVEFDDEDELGGDIHYDREVNLPLEIGMGVAFRGIKDVVIAVDARWIDYETTQLFGDTARLDPGGALHGLGWESVFAVQVGVQWQVHDDLTLRAGYMYTENPIPDADALLNCIMAGTFEHTVSVGLSWQISEDVELSAYYAHSFENSISGNVIGASSLAKVSTTIDWAGIGFSFRF